MKSTKMTPTTEEHPFLCFVSNGLASHTDTHTDKAGTLSAISSPVSDNGSSPLVTSTISVSRASTLNPSARPLHPYTSPVDRRRNHRTGGMTETRGSPLRNELMDIRIFPYTPKPMSRREFPWSNFDEANDIVPLSPLRVEHDMADPRSPVALALEDEDTCDPFVTPCLKERRMRSVLWNHAVSPITPSVSRSSAMPTNKTINMTSMSPTSNTNAGRCVAFPSPQTLHDLPHKAPCPPSAFFCDLDGSSDVDDEERPLPLLAWTPVTSPTTEESVDSTRAAGDQPPLPLSLTLAEESVGSPRAPSSASAPCSPTSHKKRTWRSVLCRMLRAGSRPRTAKPHARGPPGPPPSHDNPLADMTNLYTLVQEAARTVDPTLADEGPLTPTRTRTRRGAQRKSLPGPAKNAVLLVVPTSPTPA
eukprot:Rmarinus@m.12995